jgi:tetratricopeptide (TPR) repeat protein
VLDQAEKLGADPRFLTAARYGAAVRCQEDPAAAQKLMDAYLGESEEHGTINNDCWYLMTELATMGRYDWFAAGLADRMLTQRDTMQDFEYDTAALALFQVGRAEEAVELQQKAIEIGGASADYQLRLRRYQAGVPQPPR